MTVSKTPAACPQTVRLAWVVPKFTAGGVGPVCRYAAEAVARATGWSCMVVSLHDGPGSEPQAETAVPHAALGIKDDAPRRFLEWLQANPQDLVITNDVSRIEPAFPHFPPSTAHVVQVHDSLHRYRAVAERHHRWIDGVSCVARHIEDRLRPALQGLGFQGRIGTCHNGAVFPPRPERPPYDGPLRLLFTGKMDALIKGVLDLEPILIHLRRMNVPVHLTIVGGRHEGLARRLAHRKLDHLVTWTGRVPHDECYRIAAASDVFLMVSRREPFGMVTIEAMSMGCVPIAYDTPSGSTEIIEDGSSGLLVPLGNYRALAGAIQRLHKHRDELHALSADATERARREFGADALGARMAAFLQSVMDRRQEWQPARLAGFPAPKVAHEQQAGHRLSYQSLPAGLRMWLRDFVGSRPRLAYWAGHYWNQ